MTGLTLDHSKLLGFRIDGAEAPRLATRKAGRAKRCPRSRHDGQRSPRLRTERGAGKPGSMTGVHDELAGSLAMSPKLQRMSPHSAAR